MGLLASGNQNIIGCLVNCSSQGTCKLDSLSNQYMCFCNQYFKGNKCDIDIRPCSNNPCMNSGYCINDINMIDQYTCNCTQYYNGSRCENKIDLCQNETCSSNGYCYEVKNEAKCKCFNLYSGDKCEIKSSILKVIRITQTVSVIIVICSFFIIAMTILFLDTKWCNGGKRKIRKKKSLVYYIIKFSEALSIKK